MLEYCIYASTISLRHFILRAWRERSNEATFYRSGIDKRFKIYDEIIGIINP